MTGSSSSNGQRAELRALALLREQGLTPVAHNFRVRGGEIDLIARDGGTLVFIEVKYRQRDDFGGAAAALSPAQSQRIRRTALLFLQLQGLNESRTSCRFDVILVAADGQQCQWLRNAF